MVECGRLPVVSSASSFFLLQAAWRGVLEVTFFGGGLSISLRRCRRTEEGGGGQAVGGQAFFHNLTLGSLPESMCTRGRGAIVRYSQTVWRQQRSAQRYQLRYFDPIEELAKTTAASGQVYDVIILFGRCSDCALAATADCIRPGADLSRFA